VSQTSGATRRLWDTKAPLARETDGDGAPSLPIWKGARSLKQIVKKVGKWGSVCTFFQKNDNIMISRE